MLTVTENKILTRAAESSRTYQRHQFNLVDVLMRIARGRMYIKLARPSLIEYIVEELKFDCAFAYQLNVVVKRALAFPSLKVALEQRRISVGKASRISGSLTENNVAGLVEFACTHTFKEINEYLVGLKPDLAARESLKQVSKDQFRLSTSFTAAESKALDRVCSLLAQRNKSAKRRDAIVEAINEYVARHDRVKKAERSASRPIKISVRKEKSGRQKLSAAVVNEVMRRSGGVCEWDDPKRCTCDRHVEIHHRVPIVAGGSNEANNLSLLCWAHHDILHQLSLPIEGAFHDLSVMGNK